MNPFSPAAGLGLCLGRATHIRWIQLSYRESPDNGRCFTCGKCHFHRRYVHRRALRWFLPQVLRKQLDKSARGCLLLDLSYASADLADNDPRDIFIEHGRQTALGRAAAIGLYGRNSLHMRRGIDFLRARRKAIYGAQLA